MRLPCPPSVNALWRNVAGVGRVRTKRYNDWIKHAGTALLAARGQPFSASVHIIIRAPRTSNRDIDGYIKPVIDLLVSQRILASDVERFVESVGARWHDEASQDLIVLISAASERPVPSPVRSRKRVGATRSRGKRASDPGRLTEREYRALQARLSGHNRRQR